MSDQIYTVKVDGKVYELKAPEGTSSEDLHAAIAGQQAAEAPKATTADKVKLATDPLKIWPSAIYEAVTSLPRLAVTAGDALEEKFPTPDSWKVKIPGTKAVGEADAAIRKAITPEGDSANTAKEILAAGLSGVMTPAGVASPKASMVTGMGAGAGSEIAAAISDNPFVRILGALLGGGTAAVVQAAKPSAQNMAKEMLDGVNDIDLAVAKGRMIAKEKAGIPSNLSQNMPHSSNVDDYVEALARSKFGTQTRNVLEAQPAIIQNKVQEQLKTLPGETLSNRIVSNEAQEAATKAISDYTKRAGEAWRAVAKPDERIPQKAMAEFDAQLAKYAKSISGDNEVLGKQVIAELRRRLRVEASDNDPVAKLMSSLGFGNATRFHDNALDVKGTIDDVLNTFGPRQLNTSALDAAVGHHVQAARKMFSGDGGVIDKWAPNLKAANKAYEAIADQRDQIKKTIVGDLAGRRGAQVDISAPQGKLMSMFDKGSTPGAPSEILTLERELRKSGQQQEFLNAAKTWISERVAGLIGNNPSSRPNENLAKGLLGIFGDPRGLVTGQASKEAQGMKDVLAGMARAQGVPEPVYVKGFPRFMEMVTDLARRPGSTSFGGDVVDNAVPKMSRSIGAISIMTPLRQPALLWGRLVQSNTLREMDRLLNSSEGIALLKALAEEGKKSKLVTHAAATFFATLEQAGRPDPLQGKEDYTQSVIVK